MLHTHYTTEWEGEFVYLLHFSDAYKHARHYLGSSSSLLSRLLDHKHGNGARLMHVIHDQGLTFQVVRLWKGGRELERELKRWHSGVKLCPICKGKPVEADCTRITELLFPSLRTFASQVVWAGEADPARCASIVTHWKTRKEVQSRQI